MQTSNHFTQCYLFHSSSGFAAIIRIKCIIIGIIRFWHSSIRWSSTKENIETLIQNSRLLQKKKNLVLTKHIIGYATADAVIIQVFVRKNRLSFRDGKDKDLARLNVSTAVIILFLLTFKRQYFSYGISAAKKSNKLLTSTRCQIIESQTPIIYQVQPLSEFKKLSICRSYTEP